MNFKDSCKTSIKLVFWLNTFIIFVSLIISYYSGVYGGDLINLNLKSSVDDILLLLFVYAFTCSIYFASLKISVAFGSAFNFIPKVNQYKVIKIADIFAFSLIVFAIIVVYFTTTGNIYREGYSNRVLDLIFAVFQPFYLIIFYLYAFHAAAKIFYYINFFLFVLACFLTGFSGYVFFLVPAIVKVVVSRVGYLGLFFSVILGLIFLPLVHLYKYILKYDIPFNEIQALVTPETIAAFTRSIIDRFNYLPNLIYIIENKEVSTSLLSKPEFHQQYQGYLGSIVHKALYSGSVGNLQGELSYLINGVYRSNSTFPISAFYFIDKIHFFFLAIYSVFSIFLLCFIASRFSMPRSVIRYLVFIPSFFFLMQGWFWPFYNFVQAGLVFYLFVLFFRYMQIYKVGKPLSSEI
jgi:hypothetical protein